MQLYPAIDIKNGKCVRLSQGSFSQVKEYFDNPKEVAIEWVKQGASFLHIVDLDGALAGEPVNIAIIESIAKEAGVPIQVGGGIRTKESAKKLLDAGVYRCIIGTRALKDPDFIKELIETFGSEKIVVGIDAKDGYVATHGWESVSDIDAIVFGKQMVALGVKHIVYTDIAKDGMLAGVNIAQTKRMVEACGVEIIASGGVSGMKDLEELCQNGIPSAIIGKALYEGRITLSQAVNQFK